MLEKGIQRRHIVIQGVVEERQEELEMKILKYLNKTGIDINLGMETDEIIRIGVYKANSFQGKNIYYKVRHR